MVVVGGSIPLAPTRQLNRALAIFGSALSVIANLD